MTTIYIILGFFVFLGLLGWYTIYVGNKNAKVFRYNLAYENFKTMLYDPLRPINKTSWKELNKCFTELEEMPYGNNEKTDVLRGEFLKLYETVTDEIEAEFNETMSHFHEFDPSMIFVGE